MSKALFLDRDGTIIVDKHYLADPAGVELIPGVSSALQRARELGYKLFLFTNQSGIGRGLYTLEDTLLVNARMETLLALASPLFTDLCIAPEAPDQPSLYRKPSPRFIQEMIAAHDLEPAKCAMIGDRPSDAQAGLNAGVRSIAICTGEHTAETWRQHALPGIEIHADLAAFVATLT
ncbi:MAG: HAD-IIIA family hydrolase [Opitutaceae bacterium]|nr:HAD-IIIA family hydrolase [Opitutaceae bacterium]